MQRATHLLHRQIHCDVPIASHGEGSWSYVIDSNGKRYLDACGGAAVSCLGYSHPRVIQAIKSQFKEACGS